MERVWEDPHAKFLYRLHNQVVDNTINDISYLKFLQTNWERTISIQKTCGYVFEERGVNLLDLIAKASCIPDPSNMDAEDDEKQRNWNPPALNVGFSKKKHIENTPSTAGGTSIFTERSRKSDYDIRGVPSRGRFIQPTYNCT